MTEREPLQPHELATQIMESDYPIVNGQVESIRLASVIDRSQAIWRELRDTKFEENEYGHATIGVQDWLGDYQTASGDHVDGLQVYFHDPHGNITELGSVTRAGGSYASKATATVSLGEGKREPLLPDDPPLECGGRYH